MFDWHGVPSRKSAGGVVNPRLGGTINPRTGKRLGTGWLPDVPDLRDQTPYTAEVEEMLKKLGASPGSVSVSDLPDSVDWTSQCSPVEDQGQIGSCTAQAVVGLVEYFQLRAFGRHNNGSRLFLYKVARNLMGLSGDTGAFLRQAMGALVLCGIPPESNWPYTDDLDHFDQEPDAFVYAVADNYEATNYFCHDPFRAGLDVVEVEKSLKRSLAAGVPFVFGFYGFPSAGDGSIPGGIPYPGPGESAEWGHAVMAVGYDDGIEIRNTRYGTATKGAIRIRNSWGTDWGNQGYGWLPYSYVRDGLASDFWSLLSMEWVDTNQFGL